MRPVHALVLLLVLAGLVVGALVLVNSDHSSGRLAEATPEAVSPEGELRGAAVQLDPTPARPPTEASTRTQTTVVPTIVDGPVGLRGRVVDEQGRPVSGAEVLAAPTGGFAGIALDEYGPGAKWLRLVRARTDEAGRFTVHPEAQGSVRLAVRSPGFAPLDTEKPFAGAQGDVGDLRLERGVVLQGRVVDPSGRGVAGARLFRVREANGFFLGDGFDADRAPLATADAGGAFRIDQQSAGPWKLRIVSEAHPDKVESGTTDRPGQVLANLTFTLEAGYEIAGHVSGIPGEMVGKLVVRAAPREASAMLVDFQSGGGGSRTATVEADGGFVLRGCRQDMTYQLVARTSQQSFDAVSRSEPVEATSGDRNVALKYRAETALVFQVVDDSTGRPVEEMSVSAGVQWTMPLIVDGKAKKTFAEGRVRFAPLPSVREGRTAQVRVEAAGYEPFVRDGLRVTAGIDNELGVFRLVKGAVLVVEVKEGATGKPVVGAAVTLNEVVPRSGERGMSFTVEADVDLGEGVEFAGQGSSRRGVTDADGVARVSSFAGKRATLSVRHKEFAPYKGPEFDVPVAPEHRVQVDLATGGVAVVQVLDSAGKPVPGIDVDRRGAEGGGGLVMPSRQSDTLTDAEGKVAFAHLAPGAHEFRVRPRGGDGVFAVAGGDLSIAAVGGPAGGADAGWTRADVVEGETVTVRLVAPDRGILAGRVREAGKALAGATVRLRKKGADGPDFDLPMFGGGGLSGTTNGSGEYTISGVDVGDYDVTVRHPQRAMPFESHAHVASGENRHDLELPLAILEGRVRDSEGKPVAGARVSCQRAPEEGAEGNGTSVRTVMSFAMAGEDDGEVMEFDSSAPVEPVRTDADGNYRLRGVAPDVKLRVAVSATGFQSAHSEDVVVGADQTRGNVDVTLRQGATLEVSLRGPDGKAVPGCVVHAEPIEIAGEETKTKFTGPRGKAQFSGLAPGKWKVTCERVMMMGDEKGAPIAPQEVTLEPGKPRTLTFQVPL